MPRVGVASSAIEDPLERGWECGSGARHGCSSQLGSIECSASLAAEAMRETSRERGDAPKLSRQMCDGQIAPQVAKPSARSRPFSTTCSQSTYRAPLCVRGGEVRHDTIPPAKSRLRLNHTSPRCSSTSWPGRTLEMTMTRRPFSQRESRAHRSAAKSERSGSGASASPSTSSRLFWTPE